MKKLILLLTLCFMGITHAAAGTIVVLGDSLSAAYGISKQDGWVALLDQYINQNYKSWRVINASISGDTTAGGASRIASVLEKHKPSILMVELGGNDGLRGLPLSAMKKNLTDITNAGIAQGAKIILAGVRLPPNYGPRYNDQFREVFVELGTNKAIHLIPELLTGIDLNQELMQADGIHPKKAAQPLILENVLPTLKRLLDDQHTTAIDSEPDSSI